jgi:starch phosphorylase
MEHLASVLDRTRIAYFSMEIALRPEMHTYSGGLGGLAGDIARSCADLRLGVVFVTLISRSGYLRQEIAGEGRQVDHPDPWIPEAWAVPLKTMVAVEIQGREVWVRPWLHLLEGSSGHRVPVILLDTDVAANAADDRRITDHLYGGDDAYRLKQEIVLGIGGLRVLHAVRFDIRTFHMNESHSALLTLELLRGHGRSGKRRPQVERGSYDLTAVRDRCVFTVHTPIEAGHDRFPYPLVERLLGDLVDPRLVRQLAGDDQFNLTRLASNLSRYVNGVSARHAETSLGMFPDHQVHGITNGVHASTWVCPSLARLYQAHLPNWRHKPTALARALRLPSDALWEAHREAKRRLVGTVGELTGVAMDAEVPIIGFARRMTGYKRPHLLFSDLDRLVAINRARPLQVVYAGKAHPRDAAGKQLIERIHAVIRQLSGELRIAFLPNYGMELCRLMVSGSDVWLNTPEPPLEACGTSGMKAALNGVLNLSVLDGWWAEGCVEAQTGWAIGGGHPAPGVPHAEALYDKLERVVLPLFYEDRAGWTWAMKQAIGQIASRFNSHRMVRKYVAEAYNRRQRQVGEQRAA